MDTERAPGHEGRALSSDYPIPHPNLIWVRTMLSCRFLSKVKLKPPTRWPYCQGCWLAKMEPRYRLVSTSMTSGPYYLGSSRSGGEKNLFLKGPVSISHGKPSMGTPFVPKDLRVLTAYPHAWAAEALCAHLLLMNEFPSLSQKVDATPVFLPPPVTEKQTLLLESTVLSRSARLLEMQTGVSKDEKIPGGFCGVLESASGQIAQ